MQAGDFITDAVIPIDTSRRAGRTVLAAAGGVRSRRGRNLKGRCLSFAQREEIAILCAQGQSMRAIGEAIGTSTSRISRELKRNTKPCTTYRASSAHVLAYERASRPKPAKLHTNTLLRAKAEEDPAKKYSPEQIAGQRRVEFPTKRFSVPKVGFEPAFSPCKQGEVEGSCGSSAPYEGVRAGPPEKVLTVSPAPS
ncbi:transposase [Arthrobacter sp. GMC3]|uniref:transposase n=1 Tax=Arthrobacter sp. GMC3 TaxID=2058894 RepID=UPI0034CD0702